MRERTLKRAPSPTLSARALIGLAGCEVSALIAELNSPLGRVKSPSQRLLYEARFLLLAPQCDATGEAQQALNEALLQKRSAWTARVWEVVWRGRELSLFFSSAWPRGRAPSELSAEALSALRYLSRLPSWLKARAQEPWERQREALSALEGELEQQLSTLPPYAAGFVLYEGQLALHALQRWRLALSSLTQEPPQEPPQDAVRCERVDQLLQAYLSLQPTLSARLKSLEALTEALGALSDQPPAPFKGDAQPMSDFLALLRRDERGLSAQLKRESQQHAQALGALLQRCGRAPQ